MGWQMPEERRGRSRQREVWGPDLRRWHSGGGWWTTAGSSPTRAESPGAFITSGDGSSSGFWASSASVTSASPRMVRRWWAMTACCSSPQWFSRDRMTGYGDSWGGGTATQSHLPVPLPGPPLHLAPQPPSGQAGKGTLGVLSRWNVGHTLGPVCFWGDRGQIWGLRERVECLGS